MGYERISSIVKLKLCLGLYFYQIKHNRGPYMSTKTYQKIPLPPFSNYTYHITFFLIANARLICALLVWIYDD